MEEFMTEFADPAGPRKMALESRVYPKFVAGYSQNFLGKLRYVTFCSSCKCQQVQPLIVCRCENGNSVTKQGAARFHLWCRWNHPEDL